MKRQLFLTLAVVLFGGLLVGLAQDAVAAGPEIIGAPKCKMCHGLKTGDQFKLWEESSHAKAFTVLATDAAKKIATDKGLGDPQKEEACLKCHATQAFLGRAVVINATGKYEDAEGVGCEACHGPGSEYKSKAVMEDHAAYLAAGGKNPKNAEFCAKCHNDQSPTFKGFEFEKMWDKIKHPVPAAG